MGQQLTALGLGLQVAKVATPRPSTAWDQLEELQTLTDLIGQEIHHLALELRPTVLDDLGLLTAIGNYAEAWAERTGVEVDFQSAGLDHDRLSAAVETALYRVVREALTNVLKHADAQRVSVVLQVVTGHAIAVVEDDGRGFGIELDATPAEHRLGLLGMRERMELVGGELTIDSVLGRGTTVIARVPLNTSTRETHDG